MSKKRFNKILSTAFIVLVTAFYLFIAVKICSYYSGNLLSTIIYLSVGFIGTFIITSAFHELGHLLFARLCGFKIVEFNFLFFNFTLVDGKYKLAFRLNFKDFGVVSFLPEVEEVNKRKIFLASVGGLFFNFILLVVYLTFFVYSFENSRILFCLIGAQFLIPFYLFFINFIPFDYTFDGYFLFKFLKDSEESEMILNAFTVGGLIYNGLEPINLPEKYFKIKKYDLGYYSIAILYYDYLRLLGVDVSSAYSELKEIFQVEDYEDYLTEEIAVELFYVAIMEGNREYIEKNKEETIELLSNLDTATSIRVQLAYRIYTGETEWAKMLYFGLKTKLESESNLGVKKLESRLSEELKVKLAF